MRETKKIAGNLIWEARNRESRDLPASPPSKTTVNREKEEEIAATTAPSPYCELSTTDSNGHLSRILEVDSNNTKLAEKLTYLGR